MYRGWQLAACPGMSCRLRHLWHPLTGSHVQEPEETFERDFVRGGAEQRGRACKDGPAEGETASKEGGTEERGGGGPQSQLPQDARQDGIAHHDRVHGGHGELLSSHTIGSMINIKFAIYRCSWTLGVLE